jgi:tRNA 2-thiouridine synthesizing protein A
MDLHSIEPHSIVDARGLTCPMPLLRTKKTLNGVPVGEILEIWGTDPGSKNDIPHFGGKNGNTFLGFYDDETEGYTRYFIRKG